MAIRKTHVKSDKRIKRDKEAREVSLVSAKKQRSKKHTLGSKKQTFVQTGFRFKSQAERYKDVSVDLASLLDDAVERYGRWDVQPEDEKAKDDALPSDSAASDHDTGSQADDDDMLSSPMATALAELTLLNTSIPFQSLHNALYPVTRSLPLIIHNRHRIATLLASALSNPNHVDLALSAPHVIELLPSFIQSLCPDPDFKLLDLETILSPLLLAVVALAVEPPSQHVQDGGDRGNDPSSPVEISKRAFQVITWTLRQIGQDIVNSSDAAHRVRVAWSWVVEGLKGEKPRVQSPQQVNVSDDMQINDVEIMDGADIDRITEDENGSFGAEAQEAEVVADAVVENEVVGDALVENRPSGTDIIDEAVTGEDASSESDLGDDSQEDPEPQQNDKSVSKKKSKSGTKPHLRKLLATCFAFLVRRARNGESLENIINIVLSSLDSDSPDELSESISWLVVESIKSVDTHLHSRAGAIMRACLKQAGHSQLPQIVDVLEASLTAVVHHGRMETMSTMADLLLSNLEKSMQYSDPEPYTFILAIRLATVLCGVRKGSRLADKDKIAVINLANKAFETARIWPDSAVLLQTWARLAVCSLVLVPDLKTMMGPGRKLLEALYNLPGENTHLSIGAIITLSGQKWPYFNDFAKPLLKGANVKFGSDSRYVSLLATLVDDGDFQGRDWQATLEESILAQLQNWQVCKRNGKLTERKTYDLLDSLRLCDALPVTSSIVKAVSRNMDLLLQVSEDPQDLQSEFNRSPANSAAVLAAYLRVLATSTSISAAWITEEVMHSIVRAYGWHRRVMSNLAKASQSQSFSEEGIVAVRQELRAAILSEDALIRQSILEILLRSKPNSLIIAKAIEAENTPMDMQNSRDKSASIRKMGPLFKTAESSSFDFEIGIWYCLAMLKVNLSPLWPEAVSSISEACAAHNSSAQGKIWSEIFGELGNAVNTLSMEPASASKVSWASPMDGLSIDGSPRWRQGELICTAMARLVTAFDHSAARYAPSEENIARRPHSQDIEGQIANDRFSATNYEYQLLALCGKLSSLTERHSRDFVTLFFTHIATADESDSALSGQSGRDQLGSWLKVFTAFKNPKALYRTDDVYSKLLTYLSHGDASLQGLALDAIFTWKSPNILPYEDRLRNLLQSTNLRDELLHFSLAEDSSDILLERRQEVVNITIRLLFGLMSSRQGRASSVTVHRSRKTAILGALKVCNPDDLTTLVNLMLGSLDDQKTVSDGVFTFAQPTNAQTSKQAGFLILLGDLLANLAVKIRQHWHQLFAVTLNLAYHSRPSLASSDRLRHVRQLAFKRLGDFFHKDPTFDYTPFLPSLFADLIVPRLAYFGPENAQGPSALLNLIAAWAQHPETVHILEDYSTNLLTSTTSVLAIPNAKPASILAVLGIMQDLLARGDTEDDKGRRLIQAHVDTVILQISTLLGTKAPTLNARDPVSMRLLEVLSSLAPFLRDAQDLQPLLPALLPTLSKPNSIIPEKMKTDLLRTLEVVVLQRNRDMDGEHTLMAESTYDTICGLFTSMRTRPARLQLLAVLENIGLTSRRALERLADLDAYSARRLDEPDFDRRLQAFSRLNDTEYKDLVAQDWIPILANMFFFAQDTDELSIRTSATFTLRRFVEVAGPSIDPSLRAILVKKFMPGLRRILLSKSLIVRTEAVSVLKASVAASTGLSELEDLKCLLAGDDEEANVLNNIYHIQTHRRARALRRLADEAQNGNLPVRVVHELFIPIVAFNLAESSTSKQQELVNESVTTIGRLTSVLSWSAYNRVLQRYYMLASTAKEGQKLYVRVLVSILRSFHVNFETLESDDRSRILASITKALLPKLSRFLQARDEVDETLRLPVAEGIAAVIQRLPSDYQANDVSNLVTSLAQILRSKSQEVRDMARNTLVNIATLLGQRHLASVVAELRSGLAKGPHLHVLAFVVHALLEKTSANASGFSLDSAVDGIVPIIYDDLFGFPAKDRGSREFRAKTKYREVRLCKSLDSLEIVASRVSAERLNRIIGPLRDVLAKHESLRMSQSVDDAQRRMVTGLLRNDTLQVNDLLSLCQALIRQNTDFLKPRKSREPAESLARKEHRVELRRAKHSDGDISSQNAWRFVALGLDLLNGAFRRNAFDLHNDDTVARLEPLISLVGNTLFTEDAHILDRALRAVAALIKCPLKSIESAAPALSKQMISILENAGGTSSDLAQTTMRSLGYLIRDRKSLVLSEQQVTTLIGILSPDMEEPDQQAAVFSLLRAIVSRGFVSPEVYDLMDRIAEILVSNQAHGVREVCRAIYLQFLLDYPQGKKRLSTALQFLTKNLIGYVHESGRMSVLELLNAVLSKFGVDLVDQYADLFHVALVMSLSNDESAKCRSMAAENCKVLYARVKKDTFDKFLDTVLSWGEQNADLQLSRVAAQASRLLLESQSGRGETEENVSRILPMLARIASSATELVANGVDESEYEAMDESHESPAAAMNWQTAYQAVTSLQKLFELSAKSVEYLDTALVKTIETLLLYPHAWVRQSASRLVGTLLTTAPTSFSLSDLVSLASNMTIQLRSKLLDEGAALQVVKNLFLIGKRFAKVPVNSQVVNQLENGENDGGDGDPTAASAAVDKSPTSNPLHWLFVKLSHRARYTHQSRPSKYLAGATAYKWSLEPLSILRWFGAMTSEPSLEVIQLQGQLRQMLIPIVRVIEDPNGAQDPQLDELQTIAREVQELLANRIGTSSVTEVYSKLQRDMAVRREDRKRTNAMQAVTNPEKDAKARARKHEHKMQNRKRKGESFQSQKLKYGVMSKGKKARFE